MLTFAQRQAYLANPSLCLFCSSPDIEVVSYDGSGPAPCYQIRCETCGREWNDVYDLVDVEVVGEPEPAEPASQLTYAEFMAISPDLAWGDGREGYVWPRFDAVLGRSNYLGIRLRAEVTWDDGEEEVENVTERLYKDPRLDLQLCRMDDDCTVIRSVVRPLTAQEAIGIVKASPQVLIDEAKSVVLRVS